MLYNIYYSPTGGTKKASCMIASGFNTETKNINLIDKSVDLSTLSITDKDILIISAPCFGGVAPAPCIDKLKALKGNNAKTICVAVYGNRATDDQLLQMQDTLKECGCTVIAGIEALAEHSLARNVAKGRPNKEDEQVLISFSKKIEEIIKNDSYNKDLVLPGNKPYKEFHGSGTKPVLSPDNKCIQCRTCVVNCPVDAINEKTPWETDYDKCISCMHCVSLCPTGARITDPIKSKGTEEKLMEMAPEAKKNKLFI